MPRQKYFFTFLPFKGCTTSGSTGLIMECNNASSSKLEKLQVSTIDERSKQYFSDPIIKAE